MKVHDVQLFAEQSTLPFDQTAFSVLTIDKMWFDQCFDLNSWQQQITIEWLPGSNAIDYAKWM